MAFSVLVIIGCWDTSGASTSLGPGRGEGSLGAAMQGLSHPLGWARTSVCGWAELKQGPWPCRAGLCHGGAAAQAGTKPSARSSSHRQGSAS